MLDDRFWTKVDTEHPSGCWLWTANKNNRGYGLFRPGGTAPKELAHRLAYEDRFGPIPKGCIILHSCDNPACVKPLHLRAGSFKDNVADMDARGRRISNPCRGEANPNTTATDAIVIAVRRDYVSGKPLDEICRLHGVTSFALHDYVTGRAWAHILGRDGCPGEDALAAERQRRTRSNARLNQQIASEIRCKLAAGAKGIDLATEYGVHKATISDIKRGKIWP